MISALFIGYASIGIETRALPRPRIPTKSDSEEIKAKKLDEFHKKIVAFVAEIKSDSDEHEV